MCRILYIQNPKKFVEKFGEQKIIHFLEYLEMANGGHGNGLGGLAQINGKKMFVIRKGLGYSHDQAVKDMQKYKWVNGILWHTRLVSSGTQSSYLNHPHIDIWKTLIAIHNGHITYADDYLKVLKLLDPRFSMYKYNGYAGYYRYNYSPYSPYSKYYEVKRDENIVSDTWIATNLLAMMVRYAILNGFSLRETFIRFWSNVINGDNFIIQLFDGTVVLMIHKGEAFEYTIDPEIGFIASSQGLISELGYKNVYKGTGIIWIGTSKNPEFIVNNFKRVETIKKKVKGKIIEIQEEISEDIDECFEECYEKCFDKTGEPAVCNRVCENICLNVDDREAIEELIEDFAEHYITDSVEEHVKQIFNEDVEYVDL